MAGTDCWQSSGWIPF